MELLYKLSETFGPSGNEEQIAKLVTEEIKDYVDTVQTDALGNVIAHKAGNGKKFMLAAHMDEVGIIVTYVEKNGFLRFAPVGGLNCYSMINRQVVFENGALGVISYEEKIDIKKELDFAKMYIDIGAVDSEDAEKKVSVGDTAVYASSVHRAGERVAGKALDNRAGVYALIEVAKRVADSPFDLYYVFTSQEEIGLRGAKTSAFSINPDYALAIDVTATGDTPNCPASCVKLGGGACIKIMDKSVVASPLMRRALQSCAEDNAIPVQNEILSFGGTDAGAIHTVCDGSISGAVSIPLRYIHTPCEMADEGDINGAIKLTAEFLKKDYFAK